MMNQSILTAILPLTIILYAVNVTVLLIWKWIILILSIPLLPKTSRVKLKATLSISMELVMIV